MCKTIFITGANRGLGFNLAKLFQEEGNRVIGTYRECINEELNIIWEKVDVRESEKLGQVLKKYNKIDVLINNAAVYIDDYRKGYGNLDNLTINDLKKTLAINYFSPFVCIQATLPKMLDSGYGRIINISSGMGRLNQFDEAAYAYKISKLMINTLTISFSKLLAKKPVDVAVTSVCPGWIKTDMGTLNGIIDAEDAAIEIKKIISKKKNEINGRFYRNGEELDFLKK